MVRGRCLRKMLGADLDDLRLLHLAQINERSEVLGLAVLAQHVSEDAFVPAFVFLVGLHDGGANVEVLGLWRTFRMVRISGKD